MRWMWRSALLIVSEAPRRHVSVGVRWSSHHGSECTVFCARGLSSLFQHISSLEHRLFCMVFHYSYCDIYWYCYIMFLFFQCVPCFLSSLQVLWCVSFFSSCLSPVFFLVPLFRCSFSHSLHTFIRRYLGQIKTSKQVRSHCVYRHHQSSIIGRLTHSHAVSSYSILFFLFIGILRLS